MRVFVSYSHKDDYNDAKEIVGILEDNKVEVLWSEKLTPGKEYYEQIPFYIEQANVFIPLITEASAQRGWVHQEIGIAIAFNIPVIPVVIDSSAPVGFIGKIHAIKLNKSYQERVKQLSVIQDNSSKEKLPAWYKRAAFMEQRAEMIKEYANTFSDLNYFGLVRQKGGLSSFHIPNKHINHTVWQDRYHPETRPGNHKELQLNERIALEKHAQIKGCKLIVNPQYVIKGRHIISAKSRIKQLIVFLESLPNNMVEIAIDNVDRKVESVTLVGNYFLAESVSFQDGDGFTNTFFTRNVAEISKQIETFDEELKDLLEELGWTAKNSKENAIEELKRIMNSLSE